MATKKIKLSEGEAAICDVLRANGISLPVSLGGDPPQERPAPPEPEPEDAN